MNRTIISNRNEVQHSGVKGMKWDKKKETPKRDTNPPVMDTGENQNPAVLELKKASSFLDKLKNSVFKEKTTYRTVVLSNPEPVEKAKILVVKKSHMTWRDLLKGTGNGKTEKTVLKGFKKVNSIDLNK